MAPSEEAPVREPDSQGRVAAARRAHRLELTLFAASTLAALVVLRLVDTQIYTEPWTLDPWFYTALMTNFDFTYQWFNATYYASRLPLIVPGLFLNAFLSPEHAYVVYHIAFFLAGGVFLYLLMRSLFGMRVALFVYPAILTNAIYVDTHTWDYFDGVVITYLSAALYFLVSSIGTASRVRPALAGFFLAAAAATNLFALLLALGAVAAYLYARASVDRPVFVRRVALDAVWFSLGAAVLLVSCGVFAERHGGRFLFFMPSVDALRAIDLESYKLPTYDWMRQEPRLLVPLFLGAVAVVAWRRGSRDRGLVGLAVTAAGAAIFLVLVFWEFGRSGTFLQIAYYFSTLYPFLFVALATAVYALLGRAASGSALSPVALAGLGLAAGATPLFVIYASDRTDTWGERGTVITLILMGCALAAAVLLRLATVRRLSFVLAPLAAVLAVTSVSYASAANGTTYADFETRNSALAHADDTFALGAQLVAFMRGNELQYSLPAFWYDQSDVELTSLQSLYYYAFTFLNLKLPVVDEEFRVRVETRQPKHIVLLCTEPTCRRGGDAMRRAGYRVRQVAGARLHSGSESVWVQAYALESPTPAQS